ncbi:MAG: hypothetical protein Q8L78_01410 [Coxiellaceae bacterium]|nr:hypothetical protein [Coxiellaceae bacterium]
MLQKVNNFIKINRYTLLVLACLTADVGLFIFGIILLSKGRFLPDGELYQCSTESFRFVARERDAQAFYRSLKDSCEFLSLCVSNFTSIVMMDLCEKPCEHLFSAENTTDSMLVRTCSSNQDIGLGTMLTLWSSMFLFCVLMAACFCPDALYKPMGTMIASCREIFFAPPAVRIHQLEEGMLLPSNESIFNNR